jgi:hypothetical protein
MGWDGPMTHRQYRAWEAWLEGEWNRPSRTDHYLMKLTATLIAVNSKKGAAVPTDKLKVKFVTPSRRRRREMTEDEATAVAVGRLMGMFGGMKVRGLPKKFGGDAPDEPAEAAREVGVTPTAQRDMWSPQQE